MTPATVEDRALRSGGTSSGAIYRMVTAALNDARVPTGVTLVDLGCGTGQFHEYVERLVWRYVGVDVVRYPGLPDACEFSPLDLDTGRAPLPDHSADVTVAIETIEHLENPRALVREMVRLTKPEGWIVVTTPNQGSLLSLLSLVFKGHFNAFLGNTYPAHITALVEMDLRRIFEECGVTDVRVSYSLEGRVPLTGVSLPRALARLSPRLLSNSICVVGRLLDSSSDLRPATVR